MKDLVLFALEKRFFNKMTVLFNILIFLAVGFLFHIDLLLESERIEVKEVLLTDASKHLHSHFINSSSPLNYVTEDNGMGTVTLDYQEGWILYSDYELDDVLKDIIERDIKKALSDHYSQKAGLLEKEFIREYSRNIDFKLKSAVSEKEDNPVWIIVTVVYFLLISYSSMIANEIVYEKSTRTLPLILTCISSGKHLRSKIITAYASLLIQFLLVMTGVLFWSVLRSNIFGMAGVEHYYLSLMKSSSALDVSVLDLNINNVIVSFGLIITGVITVQIILLVIASGFTNSEQASGFQSPFYLILMAMYYLLLIYGEPELFTGMIGNVLAYVPITSMLFMPCRLLLGSSDMIKALISFTSAVMGLIIMIKMLLPVYKRNLTGG